VELTPLFVDNREDVRLERWAPRSTWRAAQSYSCLTAVSMKVESTSSRYRGFGFPGSMLQATSGPEGCKAWIKTGHLLHIEEVNR
jgi:hypothetical protein